MSGHSKWSTIKHKKGKTDAQRAKIFTKMGREISVAIKEGGADPAVNGKLRDIIAKAKALNVPNDNIDRAVKKAAGDGDKNQYEEVLYEGYGPSGVAVMVESLTDNRNRTAGDLRHYFDKFGGNLGQSGSVGFMFNRKGVVVVENNGVDEDAFMEDALLDGVEDIDFESDVIEIMTEPYKNNDVADALRDKYSIISNELMYLPVTKTALTNEDDVVKMQKLLDMLEDNDDVQQVWHNWDEPEEE